MGRIVCNPALEDKIAIYICKNSKEANLTITFSAFEAEDKDDSNDDLLRSNATFLQCWTNLTNSKLDVDNFEWKAFNVCKWPPNKKNDLRSTSIKFDVNDIFPSKVAEQNKREFEITWRLIDLDTGELKWLGLPHQNATITFHLGDASPLGTLSVNPDVNIIAQKGSVTTYSVKISGKNGAKKDILNLKGNVVGGFSIEHTKPTWHTTRYIGTFYDISDTFDSSLIVLKVDESLTSRDRISGEESGCIYVIRPISGIGNICSMRRNGDSICLIKEQDSLLPLKTELQSMQFVVANGHPSDLHKLIRASTLAAKELLNEKNSNFKFQEDITLKELSLGLCTWEAFGAGKYPPHISYIMDWIEKGMKKYAFDSILLDDGWQEITKDPNRPGRGTLKSFDLDPCLLAKGEEKGMTESQHLCAFISQIHQKFPQIHHFGVWVTLAGYWDGLEGDSNSYFSSHYGPLIRVKLHCPLRPIDQQYQEWFIPSFERLDAFWNDCFSFLSKAGVTFVKIDDQADWEWIQSDNVGGIDSIAYYEKAWSAMRIAGEKYFGPNRIIHCMSLGRKMKGLLLSNLPSKTLVRSSDDTFPNIPSAHTWHIYHNAMQACLLSSFDGVECDADMFTTFMPGEKDEDWATFHAAFRTCFSSAPLWISDKTEYMNDKRFSSLLARLTATVKSGSVKPVQVGSGITSLPLTVSAYINLTNSTNGPALKMGCSGPLSPGGSSYAGILSLWNVRSNGCSVFDFITLRDMAEILVKDDEQNDLPPKHFILFNYSKMKLILINGNFNFKKESKKNSLFSKPLFSIHLLPSEWQIWSICPTYTIRDDKKGKEVMISCVGLIDQFAGLCAVGKTCFVHNHFEVKLHHADRCGFVMWISKDDGGGRISLDALEFTIDNNAVNSKDISQQMRQMSDRGVQEILFVIDMKSHLSKFKLASSDNSKTWDIRVCCKA